MGADIPAKARLSTEDRDFFAPLGRVIFMNPFSEEREALLGRVSPGHAGEASRLDPKAYAFVTEVGRRIDRLDQRGRSTLQQFGDRDSEVMQPVFLYQVYHRYVAELDAVIHKQLRMKDAADYEIVYFAGRAGQWQQVQYQPLFQGEPTWQLLRGEAARLSRLSSDLQELWRAEARQLSLARTRVDVVALLAAARERFAAPARENGAELRLTVSAGLAVRADAERLAQVVDNLMSNALRYTPAGAPVILEAVADGDEVVIAVVDQGPGLTEEQRELVFERFYRIDASRARALGGSGIGLAIARALTSAMGGRIWAESQGPGHGSTFRVSLPRDS